ncbi:hypothetical protein LTR15_005995 [Elasticomyces elasticus]|nr:hypothetical protein LTR15_005995 [Elasticomyces elasticus]
MATRRSKRADGEKLSDNFAEVEFQTRRQLYLERRVAREEKHAHVTCKFTIFDLLPELRAQIYAFAIETDRPRSLGHLARWYLYLVKPLLLGIRKRDHVGTFRNIELLVGGPRLRATETEVERTETSSIVINVPTASKLRPRIRFVDPRGGSKRPDELGLVRAKTAARAQKIAETRENFLGYTIQDLEAIVVELRYWPDV